MKSNNHLNKTVEYCFWDEEEALICTMSTLEGLSFQGGADVRWINVYGWSVSEGNVELWGEGSKIIGDSDD